MLTLLHRAGHRIDIVENGAEAFDAVARALYDVVLMDVQMPLLDGVEATRRIRALPGAKREVPIIALTAHAMSESKAEYLAAGMTDYLSKPLNPRLLFAKLAALSPMLATDAPSPPANAGPAAPVNEALAAEFDENQLRELKAALSAISFREMMSMFADQAEKLAQRISNLSGQSDVAALQKAAHMMAGMAGNMGARHASDLAGDLEIACRAGDKPAAARLAGELADAARRASAAARQSLEAA
jgi:two-component system, sensor histidine kinase and response regulator